MQDASSNQQIRQKYKPNHQQTGLPPHWAAKQTTNKQNLSTNLTLFVAVKLLHHVWLCATPQTAAHQAPPSLGFFRQEHWSRLPFPSPMHESEKWKWSCSVVSDCQWPYGLQPTRILHPWYLPGKSTGVGCHFLLPPYMNLTQITGPTLGEQKPKGRKN